MDTPTLNHADQQHAQSGDGPHPEPPLQIFEQSNEDLRSALSRFERQHILDSLRRHHYDKIETARSLHIGLSSLYRKLQEFKIPKNLSKLDTHAPQAGGA